MDELEILENAPEGATHYDRIYLKKVSSPITDCWFRYNTCEAWSEYQHLSGLKNIRSLVDMKRIVELEELVQRIIDAEWPPLLSTTLGCVKPSR